VVGALKIDSSVTKQRLRRRPGCPDLLDDLQSTARTCMVRSVDTAGQQTCSCQRRTTSTWCLSCCSSGSWRLRPPTRQSRSGAFARRRPCSVRRRTPGWSRRATRRSSTAPRTARFSKDCAFSDAGNCVGFNHDDLGQICQQFVSPVASLSITPGCAFYEVSYIGLHNEKKFSAIKLWRITTKQSNNANTMLQYKIYLCHYSFSVI